MPYIEHVIPSVQAPDHPSDAIKDEARILPRMFMRWWSAPYCITMSPPPVSKPRVKIFRRHHLHCITSSLAMPNAAEAKFRGISSFSRLYPPLTTFLGHPLHGSRPSSSWVTANRKGVTNRPLPNYAKYSFSCICRASGYGHQVSSSCIESEVPHFPRAVHFTPRPRSPHRRPLLQWHLQW
jgi:hypothetical protein